MPKKPESPAADQVSWRVSKPNHMFPIEMTALIRFAVHTKHVKCAVCEKKRRTMWTMLCPFVAHSPDGFVLRPSEELPALTEVCDDHPLSPAERIAKVIAEAGSCF